MWSQHAIAVYSQGAGVRRRGSGPRGFSAFSGNVQTADAGYVDVATIQRALNAFYSPSGTVLVVDGNMGPKTRARVKEFRYFHGLVQGEYIDRNLLRVLGVSFETGAMPGASATSGLGPTTTPASAANSSASAAVTSAWGSIASAFGQPPAASSAALTAASPTVPVDYTKWVLIGGAAIGAVILISTLKR